MVTSDGKGAEALRLGVIGCGVVGRKRALALGPERVGALWDRDGQRARRLAAELGLPEARVAGSLAEVLERNDVAGIIVATDNLSLVPTAKEAVRLGKHVFLEKPGARSSAELEALLPEVREKRLAFRIGYNHRFHPAVLKAREILADPASGPIFLVRGRYGHGGRLGYDREWRAKPENSGGGELIDQGAHLIDLACMLLGELKLIHGAVRTHFWDMPVDDNAFLHLESESGASCWLHASCSEWKNLFSLEIYCRFAKLHIEGLGGSYGVERLTHYQMLPAMGPPDTRSFEYPRGDESWRLELDGFLEDIRAGRPSHPDIEQGIRVLRLIDQVYGKHGRPS